MLKIALISSHLSGGGAEHVARKTLECLLEEEGIAVGLITCDPQAGQRYAIPVCVLGDYQQEGSAMKKAVRCLWNGENKHKCAGFLESFRPDIIHLHDFLPFTPSMIETLYSHKEQYRCKIVMTHHTYSYLCANDSLYNYHTDTPCEKCMGAYNGNIVRRNCADNHLVSTAKLLQKRRLDKKLHSLIDWHVSPSDFLKEKMLAAFPDMPIQVLRNPCLDEVPVPYQGPREDEIVYFGRISREKNILAFAKAFAKADTGLRLHVIGDGPQAPELSEYLEEARPDNIKFTNEFLPTKKLHARIRKAKYSVLPSVWYENSPVTIVESVGLGLTPLVSNRGGMKELVNFLGVGQTFDPAGGPQMQSFIEGIPPGGNPQAQPPGLESRLNCFTGKTYHDQIMGMYQGLS